MQSLFYQIRYKHQMKQNLHFEILSREGWKLNFSTSFWDWALHLMIRSFSIRRVETFKELDFKAQIINAKFGFKSLSTI